MPSNVFVYLCTKIYETICYDIMGNNTVNSQVVDGAASVAASSLQTITKKFEQCAITCSMLQA